MDTGADLLPSVAADAVAGSGPTPENSANGLDNAIKEEVMLEPIALPALVTNEKTPTETTMPQKSDMSTSSLSDYESLASHAEIEDSMMIDDVEVESVLSMPPSTSVLGQDSDHDNDDDEPTITFNDPTVLPVQHRSSATPSPFYHSDQSDIASVKSNANSKATTPADNEQHHSSSASLTSAPSIKPEYPSQPLHHSSRPSIETVDSQSQSSPRSKVLQYPHVKPRSSMPSGMSQQEYASQCITAAEMCRLSPYALHPGEVLLLRNYISRAQVTTYLNIRNGILRLWTKNPQVSVLREEALACAGHKWLEVASVCYDWLLRNGFINFGCVHQPAASIRSLDPKLKRRTVIVIGAGVSGLGCARQLDGLFRQYSDDLFLQGEAPPRVITLEARNRVGGRVYSKALQATPDPSSDFRGSRCIAEMGGMIITGFYGNPLNLIIRGQLGLSYHGLRPETTLYDSNGLPADLTSDQLVEQLFNDSLDRVSEYKFDLKPPPLVVGNIQSINEGRDSHSDGNWTLKQIDDAAGQGPPPLSRTLISDKIRPVGDQSRFGRAATRAKDMGWVLRSGVQSTRTINLDQAALTEKATMGSVFEDAINQWSRIVDLKPLHLRLLNWHVANLEYSNATDLRNLSLGGWDIDAGNEWEGKHTMVIGGYQSMARGLLMCPEPLECQFNSPIKEIVYDPQSDMSKDVKSKIVCDDGSIIEADHIICSVPLGVLQSGDIEFNPPLPEWKQGAINRVGYGVLNKVALTYQEPFWDTSRDIFGILRNPADFDSVEQNEYTDSRGRLFQWFNVSESAGLPCLVALMAGKAGYATEKEDDESLIQEATTLLRKVYGEDVPYPKEAIITRWASDKYSYGSYSSSGSNMEWDDYDKLSRPVGNLIFAGEHTIGTHPATVHGAYMSGLRAASELLDTIIGPLRVPEPLFPLKEQTALPPKRKTTSSEPSETQLRQQYEERFQAFVASTLGPTPAHPALPPSNAYTLFRSENGKVIRERCLQKRRYASGKVPSKEVSQMTSKMWRALEPEERNIFEKRFQAMTIEYKKYLSSLPSKDLSRDTKIAELRKEFEQSFPFKKYRGMENSTTGMPKIQISIPIATVTEATKKSTSTLAEISPVVVAATTTTTTTTTTTSGGIKLKLKVKVPSPESSASTPKPDMVSSVDRIREQHMNQQKAAEKKEKEKEEEEELLRVSGFPVRKTQQPVSYVEPESDLDLSDDDDDEEMEG